MEPTANDMLSDVVPSNGMDAQSAIDKVISQRQTQNVGQTETGLDEAQSAINTVIQQRKSPKTQLNSTFASVSGINPDDAAKAQQVGGAIGLGQDLTMRNAAEVKRIADQKRFEMYDLMESDPILGRQMMRREFASVAHDDIPQLTSVGALFKVAYSAATLSPFPKDVALEISQQYEGTQYQTEEALIYHWMNNNNLEEKDLNEETRKRLKFLEQNAPPPINTYLFGGLSYAAGQARSMAPEVAKYAIAGGATYGALGLAGGPLAPATVAGGVLIGTGLGATAGVGVVTSQIEGGMIYKDLLRSGVPKDVARTLSSIGGTANGLVEIGTLGLATAPFKPLLKKVIGEQIIKRGIKLAKPTAIGAVKTAAKYYAMAEGGEQIQELSQETVSIIVEEIARSYAPGEYESKLATPEGRQELANRYLDVAEQTFKATAIIGSFGPMINLAVDAKNIRDSAKTKQFLTDLSKNVQATKLKGRSPSALANFVAAQAQGTAAETMYVDAEEMVNVLNQSGLTAQQIDNALPGVREQLAQATSGGDIQIPTAQFAANIVGTKLEAPLMEHARLAPDAISAKQAIAQQETMQQNMKDAQVEMAAQEKTNAQFVREAKEIEKVVNDQLVAAGRPVTEAAFAAKLVQARAVTGAAAAGITPAQWVARHPVPTFQSQRQAAQAAQQAPAKPFVPKVYQETTVTPEQTASLSEPLVAAESELAEAKTANSITERGGKQIGDSLSRLKMALTSGKLAEIATQAWKLLERLKENSGMKTAAELASKTLAALTKLGVEFYDPIGSVWTEGWREVEVVSWLPYEEGISKDEPFVERVISPIVRRNGEIIQRAQVVLREGRIAHEESLARKAIDAEIEAKMQSELDALQAKLKEEGKTDEVIKQLVTERKAELEAKAREEWFGKQEQQAPSQGSFEQASRADLGLGEQSAFNEASQRPEIVTWAKEKFGDRIAPDGSSVWQNFTEWFGDSKIVDAEGKPMVVYHGTESRFHTFETGRGDMIFVSTNADVASVFGTSIIPAYIKSLKPFNGEKNLNEIKDFIKKNYSEIKKEIRNETRDRENDDELNVHSQDELLSRIDGLDYYVFESSETLRNGIKELGFDSIESDEDGFVAIGIFEPTQIKSAIANVGTFGQQDPNILRQEGYRGEHAAPTNDGYAKPLNNLEGIFPDDIYSQDAARLYGTGNEQQDRQAISIIQSAKEKPNQSIKIYRAVPLVLSNAEKIADIQKQKAEIQRRGYERWAKKQKNPLTYDQLSAELDRLKSLPEEIAVEKPQINDGDWVAINKQYAIDHGESALNGKYRIVTKTVPVKHLFTDGNSIQEWGYDSNAEGTLKQSAVPATFYSALSVEVGKSTTKSASADSWKQQIKGLIAKGVVKEKEVYWSGLNNWLDLQEGKITKEQVQAFLNDGGVKVEKTILGDGKAGFGETFYEKDDDGDGMWHVYGERANDKDVYATAEEAKKKSDEYNADIPKYPSKYAEHQLPGGKNYRETLVTLPAKDKTSADIAFRSYQKELRQKYGKDAVILRDATPQEITRLNNLGSPLRGDDSFKSSHWNQENVLVHLRLNDRVDADGKKVLFVEEVQSDWGQAGREKGFVKEAISDKLKSDFKKLSDDTQEKREAAFNALQSIDHLGFDVFAAAIRAIEESENWKTKFDLRGLSEQEIKDISDFLNARSAEFNFKAQNEKEFGKPFNIPTAPFVETTSGWLELGLKQILLEAVNGGYDRVAFVDGDQSVERYRTALTEAVDEVEITRNDDGTYTYSAIKGGKPVQGEQSVSANRINEVFGKAGSKQLLEQADAKPKEIHTIASGDIEIGGEGMRKFYDTIVPQALSKMLKKLGGDKVGEVKISTRTAEATEYYSDMPNPPPLPLLTQQGFTVTPALAEQVSQGLPLFQAAEGGARGEYDPIKNLIGIGKNADYSTVAHELAHWYVVDLFRTASDPTASEASRSDADILLKWFGIAGDNVDQRLANWNAMTLDEQRRHHEAVAYNWELYLHTGKAPSVELQGVFDRFRRWLTRAYKSIRDDLNEIYKQQFGTDLPFLTDEVRGVFDRMLASEEQISRREAIDNFKGMYQTQEESGMNDATWAAYQAEIAEAHEMAVTDLTKATVKQMEWLSGARKGILKAMQAAHNALRRSVQGEESNKMDNEPVRKAERFFKTGKMVDPDGKEIEVLVGNKIDSVALGSMYPTSTTGLAPAVDLTKLRGMTMEGGLAPDLAAEMFGFSSGDELIRALVELKPFKDELKERTDARMLDEHGGMNTEAEKEEAVNKALANEVRARMVAIENRYLTKVKTPVAVIQQGAKELARTILGRMAIKDIKPRNYVAAEARVAKDKHTAVKAMQSPETAGKSAYTRSFNEQIAAGVEESAAASEALAKSVEAIKRAQAKIDAHKKQYGDVDPAIVAMKASHQQVIQGQLAKEGYKILEEVDKALAYVKRIVSDVNRKNMGADHADQIEAILERFGLMGRYVAPTTRTPLATWAQVQQDIGFDIEIPDIVQESVRKNFLELTPEEFQDVIDTVKQIAHTGKSQQLVLTMDRKVTFEKANTEIVDSINANAGGRKAKTETASTNVGRSVEAIGAFFAAHLKAAIIVQIMDGGKEAGKLWNYLVRSANNAANKETTMRAAATKRISEILDPVFKNGNMGGAGVYFPSVDRSLNREQVLVIALNMGNEGNMQRLLDGSGWTIEQVMPIIQTLTAAELNAVQEIWDHSETYKTEIIEMYRRTAGREPQMLEPKPFQVMSSDGQMVSMKGGYYPAKYDPKASARTETLTAAEQALRDLRDARMASTTRNSYAKPRSKEVHDRPLLLNLSALYSGIGEVIHDLSWREWLIDANRLMRSSSFDKAVREQYGSDFLNQIKTWIKDVAAGDKGVTNAGEMVANFLRQGISAAGLTFNIMSAAGQITGFAQSVIKVGVKWIGRGIAASVTNPKAAIERVYALSPFMASRGRTQFRELNEIKNMVQGESVAMKRVKAGGYFLMLQMQRVVDIPTWIGAYEKQLSINSDEKLAIAIADQAVIDSQGGGMLKDLSAIERGGPLQKLFTVFYSFMNTNLNLAVLKGMTEKNAGKWVAQQAMLWVAPVVTMYMLKKLLTPQSGDDDKWDLNEIAKELAAEELSFLMGSFMGIRELAPIAPIITGAKTYGTDYRGPAGLRMLGDTITFATQARQREFDTAFRKAAINIIGDGAGLPSAQINRTIDGIEALLEGETENITAPLFGVKKR